MVSPMAQTYHPVLPSYAHQLKALEAMRDRTSFALLMAMRTGKTKVTIDDWGQKLLEKKVDSLMVLAPAGVYKTWRTEIEKHLPKHIKDRTWVATWISGGKKAERDDCEAILTHLGPRILLMNIEALSYGDKALNFAVDFLKGGKSMLVVDESTIIKNPKSRRTLAAVHIANLAPYKRILSGLPTPRSPLDIFSQFWFLDRTFLNFKNFYAFRARYAVMKRIPVGKRKVDIVVGYRDVDDLQRKIAPHSFRVRLEDCYDVPKKLYSFREVEMTSEQRRMYDDLKKRATTKLASGEHVTATEVIVQILRLHQLCCGHLVDEDGQIHSVPTNRLSSLIQLLDEYEGKAIVWCSYDRDVRAVAQALRDHRTAELKREGVEEGQAAELGRQSVAQFWGGNTDQREEHSYRFQTDPGCDRMVATPSAGGRGRTWPQAGLLVYYSNTDNLEHRDQSEERASGVGIERPVTVVDMICRGTVEEKIIGSLRNKMNMAGTITGDNWREWLI